MFSEKNTINFTHIRVSCESWRNLGEDQKRFIAEEGAKLFHQGNPYHVPKRPKFYILDVRKLKIFAGEKMLYLRLNEEMKKIGGTN